MARETYHDYTKTHPLPVGQAIQAEQSKQRFANCIFCPPFAVIMRSGAPTEHDVSKYKE
jgi:hypothetical protein